MFHHAHHWHVVCHAILKELDSGAYLVLIHYLSTMWKVRLRIPRWGPGPTMAMEAHQVAVWMAQGSLPTDATQGELWRHTGT